MNLISRAPARLVLEREKKISLFFNKRFTIKGRHWKPTNIKSSDM